MKNIFHKCGFLFLLIILLAVSKGVEAMMLAPLFEVKVVVNSVGGDAEFNYSLKAYSSDNPTAHDTKTFVLQTESGTSSSQASITVGDGDTVYLTQSPVAGWKISAATCHSDNPQVTSQPYDTGLKITAYPYSSITCIFTNTKIEKNPVIIIPGILSSYLNKNDNNKTEIWPNVPKALFGLPGDKYLDDLTLNQIGQSESVILPTDIFRQIGQNDFFAGLIEKLGEAGYVENQDLFVFPYDWRLDIRTIDLGSKVSEILTKTGAPKVDIIAHSMGGLLAKYYIEHSGTSTVDKFIDIATPHLGAPSAFKTLMFGDDMGIKFGLLGLNSNEVKKIAKNMPALYQLLPSQNYFSTSSPDYKYYLYDMDDIDHDGVHGRP